MKDARTAQDFAELSRLAKKVWTITTFTLENLMSLQQQLTDKIAELGKDETDYQAREQATIDALQAQVDGLQSGAIDTAGAIAGLQSIIDAIPSNVPPVVPPAS